MFLYFQNFTSIWLANKLFNHGKCSYYSALLSMSVLSSSIKWKIKVFILLVAMQPAMTMFSVAAVRLLLVAVWGYKS